MKYDAMMGIIIQALKNKNYTYEEIEKVILEIQKLECSIKQVSAAGIYYGFQSEKKWLISHFFVIFNKIVKLWKNFIK